MRYQRSLFILSSILLVAMAGPATRVDGRSPEVYERARQRLVRDILEPSGITDPRVLQVMRMTPRHEFVSVPYRDQAYFDMALPIGERQTISSPFIVAYMTQALDPQPQDRVLEIGTGSGYQAAVLSPLVDEVYTIEIVPSLGRRATRTLARLGYNNVHVKIGDGFQGWPEHAPFDKIIVTCSPEDVPQPLVEQLKEGGMMVIPVGERYQQTLYLLRKENGELKSEALQPTLFVPMTGLAEEERRVQPDPTNPQLINGGFEQPPEENEFVPGWYYQRQVEWQRADDAPEGRHYVTFDNEQAGRPSHLLQGIGIDGREVRFLELSAWVKVEDVLPGHHRDELPAVAITFYSEARQELGTAGIGPFYGTSRWDRKSRVIRVPPQTREAIVRIGLFGARGRASFDDVQIRRTGS